jgi:hypothetical protein
MSYFIIPLSQYEVLPVPAFSGVLSLALCWRLGHGRRVVTEHFLLDRENRRLDLELRSAVLSFTILCCSRWENVWRGESIRFFLRLFSVPSFLFSLFISLCQGHLRKVRERSCMMQNWSKSPVEVAGKVPSRQDSVITSHPADVMAAPYSAAAVARVSSILSHKVEQCSTGATAPNSNVIFLLREREGTAQVFPTSARLPSYAGLGRRPALEKQPSRLSNLSRLSSLRALELEILINWSGQLLQWRKLTIQTHGASTRLNFWWFKSLRGA